MKKFNEFNRALVAKKKFFLLISAVLLSVAMQASVITQELDLSSVYAWDGAAYNTETHVFTPTVKYGGCAIWYGTDEASCLNATGYSQLVLETESTVTRNYAVTVTYIDSEGVSAQTGTLKKDADTKCVIELEGHLIKSISIQMQSEYPGSVTVQLSKLYLQEPVGKKSTVVLSNTSYPQPTDSWDFSLRMTLNKTLFSNIHVGDRLIVYYDLSGEGSEDPQLVLHPVGEGTTWLDGVPSAQTLTGTNHFTFSINSNDSALISSKGIYFQGKNITFTRVELIKYAVLWRGSFTAPAAWSDNSFAMSNASLPEMEDGNILCVHVTTATAGSQISFRHTWENFAPTVHKYFNEAAAAQAPGTFEFPITHTMLHQLSSEALRFVGYNITIDEIYVAEGTPTNTKAAFLNVSSADMATYILPFDVPSLPAGVKAYTLTNDGSEEIVATPLNALTADKPVLIIADEGEYEFISEADASDDVSGKTDTYTNGALVGTYVGINPVPASSGSTYNYLLQNGVDGVAFYQVTTNDCFIDAYRAYLSCSYNSLAGAGAPMRIRFKEDTATGVSDISSQQSVVSKVLRDGQLYILRDNNIYTIQGQIVK